jgi:deazaflavin-dependent oxidoreductase (nitroreductase family)
MYRYEEAGLIRRVMRRSGEWPPMSRLYARVLHHLDRAVFRATRGRATFTSWVTGMPIVLLTTTGAKSGQRRTLPLVAVPSEDRVIVIASNYGQRHNPAWYHNLKAHPQATMALHGSTREVTARELEGEERERWYALGVECYPGWIAYRERTAPYREIPVVELTPSS